MAPGDPGARTRPYAVVKPRFLMDLIEDRYRVGMTAGHDNRLALAAEAAEQCMSTLGPRWSHVRSVAALASEVASALRLDETLLTAAAWLHDIGYAPSVQRTGSHALDGARHLRERGVDRRIVKLVAHHSCAVVEAEERGLASELLAEFPAETSVLTDALWYCDMMTGPAGERVTLEERLDEIRNRYGPGHVVARSAERAKSELVAAVCRTEARLRTAREG